MLAWKRGRHHRRAGRPQSSPLRPASWSGIRDWSINRGGNDPWRCSAVAFSRLTDRRHVNRAVERLREFGGSSATAMGRRGETTCALGLGIDDRQYRWPILLHREPEGLRCGRQRPPAVRVGEIVGARRLHLPASRSARDRYAEQTYGRRPGRVHTCSADGVGIARMKQSEAALPCSPRSRRQIEDRRIGGRVLRNI